MDFKSATTAFFKSSNGKQPIYLQLSFTPAFGESYTSELDCKDTPRFVLFCIGTRENPNVSGQLALRVVPSIAIALMLLAGKWPNKMTINNFLCWPTYRGIKFAGRILFVPMPFFLSTQLFPSMLTSNVLVIYLCGSGRH